MWPTRIRCPHCRTLARYRYGHFIGALFAVIFVPVAFMAAALCVSILAVESFWVQVLVIVSMYVVVVEILILASLPFIRRFGVLEQRETHEI